MIHGIIQNGKIKPLDPIPPDWGNGQCVLIESATDLPSDDRADIEQWYAELQALGPAEYRAGESEAVRKLMAAADLEAKELVRKSWAKFDAPLPAGHEPSERPAE